MIHVDRNSINLTVDFSLASEELLERLKSFSKIKNNKSWQQRGVKSAKKELYLLDKFAKPLLYELFQKKCAYCESAIQSRVSIDRFRPENFAAQMQDKSRSFEHYWWLSGTWQNLYLVCNGCNTAKGNYFPVKGPRGRELSSWEEIEKQEHYLLLDPCIDNPEKHLLFTESGNVEPLSSRGEVTIELLDLNRTELLNNRRIVTKKVLTCVDTLGSLDSKNPRFEERCYLLAEMIAPDARYSAAAQGVIRSHKDWPTLLGVILARFPKAPFVDSLSKLTKVVGQILTKDSDEFEHRIPSLIRIEIKNFRAIHELVLPENSDLDLERWLILIGENGCGKSTILKAISLIFADEETRLKLAPEPEKLINRNSGAKEASIKAWFSHDPNNPVELKIMRGKNSSHSGRFEMQGQVPKIPLLAYGSTRLPAEKSAKKVVMPSLVRIENLFNPWAALGRPEKYFADTKRVNSDEFNILASGILKLLDMGAEEEGEEVNMQSALTRRSGSLFLKIPGSAPIPMNEQSDGYQSVVTLVSDIMMNLAESVKDMENASGLVLIDEIGCHLHPSWRIRIVETMRMVFPNVRFIISTHEPLCLRGSRENEVYRVYRDEGEVTTSVLNIPPGLSADQLLTGAWFGLTTTLDQDTLDLMEEHRKMLVMSVPEMASQRIKLEEELRRRLSPSQYADTSMDRMVRSIAAEEIEKQHIPSGKLDEKSRSKIRDVVRARLKKGK